MRLGGRVQAAIEVLSDIEKRNRPASQCLKDWGNSHRFAGSGDRSAIGNLVYDALRNKSANAFCIGSDSARGVVMAVLVRQWEMSPQDIIEAFEGDKFAPEPLNAEETFSLENVELSDAPLHIQANIPEWCVPSFEANFDEDWVAEASALCARPPLDLRVNTLKAERDKVAKALLKQGAKPTTIAREGLRIKPGKQNSRLPNVQAEAGFQKGWFEIQDEGSQIVGDLVFARPGEKVLDFCAGAGGKTLALSATMENKGQVHAHDSDKTRLKPIYERLKRAGTRNVQVHGPDDDMSALVEKMDRVVIDAPCTGSGTWRRRPDAKWRLTKNNLEERLREQEEVLSEAAPFVRPGGFLIYITCSLLPEENENQVYSFMEDNPQFELLSAGEVWQDLFGLNKPNPWSSDMMTVTLTPESTGTDGFFFAVMGRK
ncbi:MAG: RsmB/NOP family class I SAM-dependent RNA methyltransferase [Rhizobiaceae bacterium]|nr:RsmB/NOP family class I SAM-dependent RNA methyltransferase [Rhizobiaceae bacterium]